MAAIQELLVSRTKQPNQAEIEAKRAVTAKMLAANKARAAAILQQALQQLEGSASSSASVKRNIIV